MCPLETLSDTQTTAKATKKSLLYQSSAPSSTQFEPMSTAATAAALNSPINRLHHFHYRDQRRHLVCFQIRCSDSKPRGFGSKDDNRSGTVKEQKESGSRQRKSVSGQSGTMSGQAPGLSSTFDGNHDSIPVVREFEERLEAVRRFEKDFSVIDYDAPVEAIGSSIGLGTKIGVGVAVVAFGLVFAFGDFLPSGSVKTTEAEKPVTSKLSEEERATLEMLGSTNFEILGGLTNALLAAKKPEEAVQVLMQARERLSVEQVNDVSTVTKGSAEEKRPQVDPIQGIILKENGNVGESERMFIQARFFAPEKAKALVDRYSRG